MPNFAYLKLTDKLACQGAQTAYGALHPADLISAQEIGAVEDQESLTFKFARLDGSGQVRAITGQLRAGRVVTVAWDDGAFDEWRVASYTMGRGEQGAVTVSCVPLWLDLVERADSAGGQGWVSDVSGGVRNFEYELTQRTPTDILSNVVLPACPTYVALGTVDPAYVLQSLSVSRLTPGALVLAVRDALRAVNVPCEARLVRNGTTNYLLNLVTQVGAGAATPVFHPATSLLSLKQQADPTLQATRVLVKGATDPAGTAGVWGRARWVAGAPSGNTFTLSDPNGGASPVAFDGQWVGKYLLRVRTGRTFAVTASAVGQVTLGGGIGTIAAGELFEFRDTEPLSNTQSTGTRYAVSSVPDGTHVACAVSAPIDVNGQYLDWYARAWSAGSGGSVIATTRIGGSVASTDVIAVASSAGITNAHFLEFIQLDGAGEIPSMVSHPVHSQPDPVGYGIKVTELTQPMLGVTQLIPNPWMRNWAGAGPDGWVEAGPPAVSKNTNPAYTQFGGNSWAFTHAINVLDTATFQTPTFYAPYAPGATRLSLRAAVYFTTFNSFASNHYTALTLYALTAAGALGASLGEVRVMPRDSTAAVTIVGAGAWLELKVEGVTLAPGTAPYGLAAVFTLDAGGDFTANHTDYVGYLDLVEAYPFATCPNRNFEFGDATALLQAGCNQLATVASPPLFYTFTIRDYARAFPADYARLTPTLGANVRAVDRDYGIDATVRLLKWQRDLLNPLSTVLTLANRPMLLTNLQQSSSTSAQKLIDAALTGTVSGPSFVALTSTTVVSPGAEIATPAAAPPVVQLPDSPPDGQGASVTYVPATPATGPQTVVTVGTPPSRQRSSGFGATGRGTSGVDWFPGDLRRFGAKCDGRTDDTTKVQDAINSGEEPYAPFGRVALIGGTLTVTAQKFSMTGRGTLKLAPGANCSLLKFDNAPYGRIEGPEFDGNGVNQSVAAPLLYFVNGAYGRLIGIHVHDSKGAGIRWENANASSLADELNLEHSFVFSNAGAGVELDYAGSPVQGTGDCIIGPTNHINYNGTYGVHIRGGSANSVQGNNILTNGSHGVYVEGVPGVSFATRHLVNGNQVRNNGGSGLYVYAGGGANRGSGLIITSNHFHYNNAAGGGSSNADVFDTDYPIIAGNHFGDLDFTARAIYGLQLSRVLLADLRDNQYHNNVTADTNFVNSTTFTTKSD